MPRAQPAQEQQRPSDDRVPQAGVGWHHPPDERLCRLAEPCPVYALVEFGSCVRACPYGHARSVMPLPDVRQRLPAHQFIIPIRPALPGVTIDRDWQVNSPMRHVRYSPHGLEPGGQPPFPIAVLDEMLLT
jgi:hypothetical protein